MCTSLSPITELYKIKSVCAFVVTLKKNSFTYLVGIFSCKILYFVLCQKKKTNNEINFDKNYFKVNKLISMKITIVGGIESVK